MEMYGNEDGSNGFQIAPFPAGREVLVEFRSAFNKRFHV
jgi:hypothetical protein